MTMRHIEHTLPFLNVNEDSTCNNIMTYALNKVMEIQADNF